MKKIGISTFTKLITIGGPVIYSSINKIKDSELKMEIRTSKFDLENFYTYDYNKINEETGKFISYYALDENEELLKKYPHKELHIIEYKYNFEQNSIILELATDNLTKKSIKILQLITDNKFLSLGKTIIINQTNFIKLGRMCSNVNNFSSEIITKKIKINYDNQKGFFIDKNQFVNINTKLERGDLSNLNQKFQYIINQILKYKEKTLLYSNFYNNGFKIISIILNFLKIEHFIIDISQSTKKRRNIINNFNSKNNNINVILFHPDIYEGLSLMGIRHLHILEPIPINIERSQLIARCVRYKSHAELPHYQRYVNIYDHIFEQAVLVEGSRYELKNEIKYIRGLKNKEKIDITFSRIKNNNKENNIKLWNKNKFKYSLALFDVLYTYSSSFISNILVTKYKKEKKNAIEETPSFLQEQANTITGKNEKLLKYLDNLLKSSNNRDKIFNLYNQMYGPHQTRNFLLLNPDHHIFINSQKYRINNINLINSLKKKDISNYNDKECLKRECEIWRPLKEGNCNRNND